MKKTLKRMLTIFVVFAMLLTMIAVPASAAVEKVVLAAINPADVNIADVVSTSAPAYLSGTKLGSANLDKDTGLISSAEADLSKINDEFKVEGDYVWAYVHNQGATTEDRTLSKHFAAIKDGETFNLSATVKFNYATPNHSTHYIGQSFELSGVNGNLPIIQYGFSPDIRTVRFLNDGGANYFQNYQDNLNTDVKTTGEFRWIYSPKKLDGHDIFSDRGADNADYIYAFANRAGDATALDDDITLTLTAKPNDADSSKYDVTLITSGIRINATSTRTVDKALILGLTDFHMVTSRSTTNAQVTAEKLNGIKNLEIYTKREKVIPDADMKDVYLGDPALVKSEILMYEKSQDMDVSDFVLKSDEAYATGESWGVDSASDKTNGWSNSDGYLWGAVHNHTGEHTVHTASAKFTPVAAGETLKLSTQFKINTISTNPWHTYGISLKGDNNEIVRLFDIKINDYYKYMHLLSGFTANNMTDAYEDTSVVTTGWAREGENVFDINGNNIFDQADSSHVYPNLYLDSIGGYVCPLSGILTITLTAEPDSSDNAKYNLTQNLKGSNIDLTSVKTVDAAVVSALNSFNIMVGNSSSAEDGSNVIGVRNVKIEQLNTSGKKVLAKVNPANVNIADIVTTSDASYLDGTKLGSANLESDGRISSNDADLSKMNEEFKLEDGYLWGYIHNQGSVTEDRTVSKHFNSINDGEILNVSATVRFAFPTTNDSTHYTGASIELSGENGNLALIQYGVAPWQQTVRFLNNGGANYFAQTYTNSDVTTTGQFRWIYAPKQLNGNDLFYSGGTDNGTYIYALPNRQGDSTALDGDITLTLTAKPSATDSSKYDLTLVTAGPNIDAVSTRTVDKALILGVTDISMVTSRSTNQHVVTAEKLIGLKNILISSPAAEGIVISNNLKNGTNKVYVPVLMPADTKADFVVIAAVCDKNTDMQKEFFINKYQDAKKGIILEIDVDVTSASEEYVEVFVFDSFKRIVPYATSGILE